MGAATTPSVRTAIDILTAASMASLFDSNFFILPSPLQNQSCSDASSRGHRDSSSRSRFATPSTPMSFSTRSARSFAMGISIAGVGSATVGAGAVCEVDGAVKLCFKSAEI